MNDTSTAPRTRLPRRLAEGCVIGFAALACAACTLDATTDPEVASSEAALAGGTPATDTAPWAVELVDLAGGEPTRCTATVLSAHWIVTAAHCVKPRQYRAHQFQVSYTDDVGVKRTARRDGLLGGEMECFRHPNYVSGAATHDVALCSFENRGLDTSKTGTAEIYALPAIEERTNFTIFGYGDATNRDGEWICENGSGTKRKGTFGLAQGNPGAVFAWATGGFAKACDGDSGGPWALRIHGTYWPFALQSGKTPDGDKEAGALLGLNANGNWIERTVEQKGYVHATRTHMSHPGFRSYAIVE